MTWYRDASEGWAHYSDPHVELLPGPDRVYDDNPRPDLPRRPIGFRPTENEPLLWDGDNA